MPSVVEPAWDSWWTKQGFFEPQFTQSGDNLSAGSFVITVPPPNVTGALHCGHAMGTALQDLLIRWHRMRGFTTLYLPGCDHASISTQMVVEKILWKKEKRTRHDLGREKFLQRALEWKDEYVILYMSRPVILNIANFLAGITPKLILYFTDLVAPLIGQGKRSPWIPT